MALRSLAARTRAPAAAALRLTPMPAPRASPPRQRFYGSAQSGHRSKGINLQSASVEEVRRQADLVGKEIDEALGRTREYREKVPEIWEDIWGTVRLWSVTFAAIEFTLFVDSRLYPQVEPEK